MVIEAEGEASEEETEAASSPVEEIEVEEGASEEAEVVVEVALAGLD